MLLFNTKDQTFESVKDPIPEGCYLVDEEQINAISASLTGGGEVWEENGELHCSGKAPSLYHRFDLKRKTWIIDKIQKSELITQQRETIRQQINAKRDVCVDGGVYVPMIDKWVDTDKKGRATLVEIKADFDLNGKENTYTLICADNTAKTINFEEFKAVWDATKNLKEKMYENAYMHKILLEAEENPLDYDWSIGWCQTYEEYKNEQTQK